jgi:hypothetical protein
MGLVLSRIILISNNQNIRNYMIYKAFINIFFSIGKGSSFRDQKEWWFKVRQKPQMELTSDARGWK